MKWQQYYILGTIKGITFQVINNWHEFATEEWHLLSIYRSWRNRGFEYNFCLLGFRLRTYETGHSIYKRKNKQ